MNVRQIGFQEADVVDMCKPITKYCVQLERAEDIRYELEKARYTALHGRPGPVLIDIPDNLQRELVDPDSLRPFCSKSDVAAKNNTCLEQIKHSLSKLKKAERPIIILGWGVRLSGIDNKIVKEFIEKIGAPVILSWGGKDLIDSGHPLFTGVFGTHGSRAGNFAVQNSDFVLSVGCRLNPKHTGSPPESFARGASKFIVDIDINELGKFNPYKMNIAEKINCDAAFFIETFLAGLEKSPLKSDFKDWCSKVAEWKEKYYPVNPANENGINPGTFLKQLSDTIDEKEFVVVDTGCTLAWTMKYFLIHGNQRLFHAFNSTPMGYALPAAVGGSFALDKGNITCIAGDGGFQMNIQELATVAYHSLPVKIFLFNNKGYGMIRQTQTQWLDSTYEASSFDNGIPAPDFVSIVKAYNIPSVRLCQNDNIELALKKIYDTPGPFFCELEIAVDELVLPQVKFGKPLEDAEPYLPREEFKDNIFALGDKND